LNGKESEQGGQLTLGGYEKDQYEGELHWMKVPTKSSYWEVDMDKVELDDGRFLYGEHARAIIDTGTTLITCPSYIANALNRLIGGEPIGSGMHSIDCAKIATLPELKFKMGQFHFSLSPNEYVMRLGAMCVSSISGLDLHTNDIYPVWILGDVFLRKYYSVFDVANRRIGLALAKQVEAA